MTIEYKITTEKDNNLRYVVSIANIFMIPFLSTLKVTSI
jgi:hypothetical protein